MDWFRLDKSSKGDGRGIGLYHVKQLCGESGVSLDKFIAIILKFFQSNYILEVLEKRRKLVTV